MTPIINNPKAYWFTLVLGNRYWDNHIARQQTTYWSEGFRDILYTPLCAILDTIIDSIQEHEFNI